jgi:hypothetical protein
MFCSNEEFLCQTFKACLKKVVSWITGRGGDVLTSVVTLPTKENGGEIYDLFNLYFPL